MKKRGFSIVEVVVSLLIIAVMSAGVFSTIALSISYKRKNNAKSSALRETENVIRCFQSSDFSAALVFCYGENSFVKNNESYTIRYDADGKAILGESEEYSFSIEASVTDYKLNVKAEYSGGGVIYETTFKKA